ncbi:MAG: hypothetical protein QM786_14655 [Breznakibacter sp.]
MRICLLVPDGTGLRNYLYSSFVDHFAEHDEVVLYTTLSDEILQELKKLHPDRTFTYQRMPIYGESFTGKLLKEAITYARLRYNTQLDDNPTTMINWTRKKYKGATRLFFVLAAFIGRLTFGRYKGILFLESWYKKVLGRSSFVAGQKDVLREMSPDVLFCTHQRSIDASAVVEAASQLGIPSVGAVYSWDNLPKARLLVRSEYYVVWSQFMKEEMNKYYPEIPDTQIAITGTPQFEFYHRPDWHLSKNEFCEKTGLDPQKKIICFSGNDLTFPCDDLYLRDVAEMLMEMPGPERPQLLLRRCPVDLSGRFEKVVKEYPGLIKVSDPLWKSYKGGWDSIVPTPEDVALLVNVSLHSDAVINVGSTMAHDFAVFDKPAIYINYDQPEVTSWSARVNNQYQQFRSMPAGDCVIWLNGKEEIVSAVNKALHQPSEVAQSRGDWFRNVVLHPVTEASKNLASYCLSVANRKN